MSLDGSETLATITQSVAIIDFLDNYMADAYPMFPKDPLQRARVLEIVNTIACDTHPLQNLRVLQTYPEERRTERAKEVITAGLGTVEAIINAYNPNFDGKSCLGFGITAAEILLVPQMYNAVR
jgi:maleylpyruvate isomerase